MFLFTPEQSRANIPLVEDYDYYACVFQLLLEKSPVDISLLVVATIMWGRALCLILVSSYFVHICQSKRL